MTALQDLKNIILDEATITLWVFKGPRGATAEDPKFTGRWTRITPEVVTRLKGIVSTERELLEETLAYDLMAENGEGAALEIPVDETSVHLVTKLMAAETIDKQVTKTSHLLNSDFYVAKIIYGENIAYAFKKTESLWKTKKNKGALSVVWDDNTLAIENSPRFDIYGSFDFFVVGEAIIIKRKRVFESVLRYKQAHEDDFQALQADIQFNAIFEDIAPIVAHVGNNKIQLRRACSIKEKGHFKDPVFLQRLRQHQGKYKYNIQFNATGQILATADTCSQIITALLNQRLWSDFTEEPFDVPSTVAV